VFFIRNKDLTNTEEEPTAEASDVEPDYGVEGMERILQLRVLNFL